MRFVTLFLSLVALLLSGCASSVQAAELPKAYTNSIGMEFALIPAGSFKREFNVVNEFNETLYRPKVIVSKAFYLGKYEVTQEQWMTVMGDNPSAFKGRTNPVENVSWNGVQEFIKRLNAKEGHTRYRLPMEAEWELAARGGMDTEFFVGNYSHEEISAMEEKNESELAKIKNTPVCMAAEDAKIRFLSGVGDHTIRDQNAMAECNRLISEARASIARTEASFDNKIGSYAWFGKNNNSHSTHPVGQKKPNPYGLYDIYGNVWEWVQDWLEDLPTDWEVTDYRGPAQGFRRVHRGGSWYFFVKFFHHRGGNLPGAVGRSDLGFRLAFSPE